MAGLVALTGEYVDSPGAPSLGMDADDPTPLVSICVPTYNGARFLSKCLDTALAQTWTKFELVIVDDRSSDGTPEIAAAYAARDPRVKLYQNDRNLGLAGNWNRCILLSQGAWIKFLFQDDLLHPTCIARMLAVRRRDTPLIVARRTLDIEPDTPDSIVRWYEWHAAEGMIRHLFPGISWVKPRDFATCVVNQPMINCIGEPTATLVHRSAFDRFGLFNPNFKVLTDWDFFARVAIHYGLCYIDDELATFRVHSKSTTQRELGQSPFHDFDLDKLIMFHELAYSDAFEPAREEARRRRHAIDLRVLLAREVQRVRRKAKDFAGALGQPDGRAHAQLAELIRVYPRLAARPRGYLTAAVYESLRHARWRVMRRAERLISTLWGTIRARRDPRP
jgi:glycosyltransferase involved in cell wall biosynthesis